MSTARRLNYTYREYLAALEASAIKLEYSDGQIYAMAGGTSLHALLAGRVARALGRRLAPGCELYSSDLRVRVEAVDLTTFPDATVLCDEPQQAGIDPLALVNPSLVVEVTRPSTESYDRGEKLASYKKIASLRAVLVFSHRSPVVSVIERHGKGWTHRDVTGNAEVVLSRPDLRFAVDEVYSGIRLDRRPLRRT